MLLAKKKKKSYVDQNTIVNTEILDVMLGNYISNIIELQINTLVAARLSERAV